MQVLANDALTRIRSGISLGFGVQHLRGAAAPLLAKASGYDWQFIDSEHGALSTDDVSQLCLSSLTAGIAPIVRVCRDALDEGTRALDAGALGLVIPHIDTVGGARARGAGARGRGGPRGGAGGGARGSGAAGRGPPSGRRSAGGPGAQGGY